MFQIIFAFYRNVSDSEKICKCKITYSQHIIEDSKMRTEIST